MVGAAAMVLLCYLLGSVPFPVLVSRLAKGIDIREHGSGNMGATNGGLSAVDVAVASVIYPVLGWYWLQSGAITLVLAMWGLVVFYLHLGDVRDWLAARKKA